MAQIFIEMTVNDGKAFEAWKRQQREQEELQKKIKATGDEAQKAGRKFEKAGQEGKKAADDMSSGMGFLKDSALGVVGAVGGIGGAMALARSEWDRQIDLMQMSADGLKQTMLEIQNIGRGEVGASGRPISADFRKIINSQDSDVLTRAERTAIVKAARESNVDLSAGAIPELIGAADKLVGTGVDRQAFARNFGVISEIDDSKGNRVSRQDELDFAFRTQEAGVQNLESYRRELNQLYSQTGNINDIGALIVAAENSRQGAEGLNTLSKLLDRDAVAGAGMTGTDADALNMFLSTSKADRFGSLLNMSSVERGKIFSGLGEDERAKLAQLFDRMPDAQNQFGDITQENVINDRYLSFANDEAFNAARNQAFIDVTKERETQRFERSDMQEQFYRDLISAENTNAGFFERNIDQFKFNAGLATGRTNEQAYAFTNQSEALRRAGITEDRLGFGNRRQALLEAAENQDFSFPTRAETNSRAVRLGLEASDEERDLQRIDRETANAQALADRLDRSNQLLEQIVQTSQQPTFNPTAQGGPIQ